MLVKQISIQNLSDDILIIMDLAIPCGLILNELITNAVKHAFVDTENGLIIVSAKKNSDSINLSVQDNGIAYQDIDNFKNTFGLGLNLVHNLVRQIDGTISFKYENGLNVTISFPQEKKFC
jgi:two-component sensor histidine kinase